MKKESMLDKEFLRVPNSFNLFKTKASLRSLPIPCSDGGVKYFVFSETDDEVTMPYAWFKLGKDRNVVVEYKCVLEEVSKENYKEFSKLLKSKEKDGMYNFLKLALKEEKFKQNIMKNMVLFQQQLTNLILYFSFQTFALFQNAQL